MELHLQGKRDERFISMCRIDSSSIKRHKERWHNLPDNKPCCFVPSTAPEVALLADKYAKMKVRKDGKGNKLHLSCHPKSLSSTQSLPLDDNLINENDDLSEIEFQNLQGSEETNEHPDPNKPKVNPWDSLDDDLSEDSLSQKSDLPAKNQKTLLEFAKLDITVLEKDTSLKQVMDAVAELSLKVDSIAKQHTTFLQLAFEDNDVRKSVSAMRKAENILELTESPQLLEWFYYKATVLRCLPCF